MRKPTYLITRVTSRNLGPISPQLWGYGPGLEGIELGVDHLGRKFCFDPFFWYEKGYISNPNVLIFGQLGSGKSALIKLLMLRASGRYGFFILDPKGEYLAVAQALGGDVVGIKGKSGPLNPFSAVSGDWAGCLEMARLITSAALGSKLSSPEAAVVEDAVAGMLASGAPCLPAFFYQLREIAKRVGQARRLELAIRPFVVGAFSGLIDGTQAPSYLTGSVFVVDLSSIASLSCFSVVMSAWFAWLRAVVKSHPKRCFLIVDEAWALMHQPESVRFLQASFKLARSYGLSNIAILHRYSDLAAGSSEVTEVSKGLLSDTETQFSFRTTKAEIDALGQAIELSNREKELLLKLSKAHALVKAANRQLVVRFVARKNELPLIDTDAGMNAFEVT